VSGRLVEAEGTRLHVVERGDGPLPLFLLHGGPGLDHTEFGEHLDALGDAFRLLLVDLREQGRSDRGTAPQTWTVEQFARDVDALAGALQLERYAVLGHSFGAFVALRHALDHERPPVASILSSGVPATHWMEAMDLEALEPAELREQVRASLEREASVDSHEAVLELIRDQFPLHFADPQDPRIEGAVADLATGVMSPEVLRHAATGDLGDLEVEDRLADIAHPVLVLTGRHDRLTTAAASEFTAQRIVGAELVVFERSAHMAFIEEEAAYVAAVRDFLSRRA
jgi:proline iminopeptidase